MIYDAFVYYSHKDLPLGNRIFQLLEESGLNSILEEIAIRGKINNLVSIVEKYLNNLSNRDFVRFDEKYVKIIFYSILMSLNFFRVKSEMEVNRRYPDILLIPKEGQEV